MKAVYGAVALLSCLTTSAWAVRTVQVDQTLVLRLESNQPSTLIYPEPLADTTKGYDDAVLEVKAKGPNVYVVAKNVAPDFTGRFFVTGESGEVYMVSFKMATPSDDKVYVVLPTTPTTKAPPLDATHVLQYLYAEKPVPGSHAVTLPAPALTDGRLVIVGMTSVRVQGWVGVRMQVRNTQEHPLVLDVRAGIAGPLPEASVSLSAVAWPPAYRPLLVTAREEVLHGGSETTLYVVLEKDAP